MNNFLVLIKGNETVNNIIRNIYHNNFGYSQYYKKESCKKNENLKYLLTDKFIENYIFPFLIKENINCVINEFDLYQNNINDYNDISFQFYSSNIYFEGIENTAFENKKNKYKEYKVKNKNVLLIHGYFYFINNKLDKNENIRKVKNQITRNNIKKLYSYLERNEHDLHNCFNNIEGNFILIYVKYNENKKINFYFYNDNFGTKSFLYFYGNKFIALSNVSPFFIHYPFNYIHLNETCRLFNDNSINEKLNLINNFDLFSNKCENNLKKNESILNSFTNNDKTINGYITYNINPQNIYNLIIEKENISIEFIKKKKCIYTNDYFWKNNKMTIQEIYQNILFYFENLNKKKYQNLKETINEFLQVTKNENMYLLKQEQDKSIKEHIITKFNNLFVKIFIVLLSDVIKKKIKEIFLNDVNNQYNKKTTNQNDINQNFINLKKKSIGILFSGGIDSSLITIFVIKHFFNYFKNGYVELINVSFNKTAIDRYTSLIVYDNILKLFPFYDIRLIFIDVTTEDLIKYEKLIYSLITPNVTVMDFNISYALFFCNLGKGILCSKFFFKTNKWLSIKNKLLLYLNIKFDEIKKEYENISEKNFCRICKYIRNNKCKHQCCCLCCRKLRYIYKEIYKENKKMNSSNYNEQNNTDIYEKIYDEKTNSQLIYIIIKNKKILIDFEIFEECNIHKDILYDYKKISNLFIKFNKLKNEENNTKIKEDEKKKKNEKNENNEDEENLFNDVNEILYNYIKKENQNTYYCNNDLLIIGSGADEFYGGYYRQNTIKKNKNDFKMNEMIKDIKNIWLRNLYRDDRILSFTNLTNKYIFYPYLNINIVNFLFSIPFHMIQTPFSYISNINENENENEINIKLNENDKYKIDNIFYSFEENLFKCKKLYEIILKNKINKWILRMSLYFLKMEEIMFFKKKSNTIWI